MENFYKIPAGLWMPLLGFDAWLIEGTDVAAALISIVQHTEAFPARLPGSGAGRLAVGLSLARYGWFTWGP